MNNIIFHACISGLSNGVAANIFEHFSDKSIIEMLKNYSHLATPYNRPVEIFLSVGIYNDDIFNKLSIHYFQDEIIHYLLKARIFSSLYLVKACYVKTFKDEYNQIFITIREYSQPKKYPYDFIFGCIDK